MSAHPTIGVGTRGSALAMAQTEVVCAALRDLDPSLMVRVERITTTGDIRTDVPLWQLDRGMFVTEIENALREKRVDVAVHSAKDLPSTLARDLTIAAFLPRADARDVLISRDGRTTLEALPAGSRVGTSSPRRIAQLRAVRPDLDARDVRGNVDTRLRKLRAGEYDALLLAAAGLIRLGRDAEVTQWLDPEVFIPCVGQGALAVEVRADDDAVIDLARRLDDAATRTAVLAERAFLAELGAGCRAAAAAHAIVAPNRTVRICAMIGSVDGRQVRASRAGTEPQELGSMVARSLLRDGGAVFLAREDGPLRGSTIAVTRPPGHAEDLVALLRANGANTLSCPAIAIEHARDVAPLDAALRDLSRTTWIVFTSANAVDAVADRLDALGIGVPANVRLSAVGMATAAQLLERVRAADFIPTTADAETLAAQLPDVDGARVLFPRGALAAHTPIATLRARGAVVRDVVVYHTIPGDGIEDLTSRVRSRAVDAVVFASPSAVRFVSEALDAAGVDVSDRPAAITIGPSTTRAAAGARWADVTQASTPTTGALLEAVERALAHRRREAALSRS